jgi:hypothetical protein
MPAARPGTRKSTGNTPYRSADATDAEHAARLVQKYLDDGAAVEPLTRAA